MKPETKVEILLVIMLLLTSIQWVWNGKRYDHDLADYIPTISQDLGKIMAHL